MRKSVERMYNINKMNFRIKLLTVAMCIFALITILMVFSSLYLCEMKIYQRTTDEQGQEEIKLMVFGDVTDQNEYNEEDNIKKITFANMAFGLDIDEDNLAFIPVAQDVKFLLVFLSQIIAYLFVLNNFFKNKKIRFIASIIGTILLVGVSVYAIVFFNGYAKDLEMACKLGIEAFRQAYPSQNITSTLETNYASTVDVNVSPVVGLSVAFMLVSAGICLYCGILNKSIESLEKQNAKK